MRLPTLKIKDIDWTVITAYVVLIALLVCLVVFAPWFFCGLGIGLLIGLVKDKITEFIDMDD